MRRLLLLALVACSGTPATPTPDASKSSVTPSKTTGIAVNESVSVEVTARDANSEPLRDLELSATLAGTSASTPARTDSTGKATFSVVSSTVGTKPLVVTVGGVTLPTVNLEFVAGPPVGFEFVTQPMNVKAGAVMAPVTLRIVDAQGNTSTAPYTVSVRLTRSPGGMLTGGAARMAADGGVTFDMLSITRPQVGCALRAESPSGAAQESNPFDVLPGDPDMGMSTLTAMPASLMVNAMTTLTLTVRDVAGNALSSVPVSLSVSGTGNTLGMATGQTGGNGVFTTTLASSVAETKTVTATVGSVMVTTMVTFTP